MKTKEVPKVLDLLKTLESQDTHKVHKTTDDYLSYFDKSNNKDDKKASEKSVAMTDQYYNLATDFYEYGWGESFHFARLQHGESKEEAFAKHQYYLAMKLQLKPSDKVLDCGCGIGGPTRKIAQFAEVNVTGININDYQLQRARELTEKRKLQSQVQFKKEDFNQMTFEDSVFDKVYAIEATCHSVDARQVYSEIYRVLKPGGLFACYEWCTTSVFDPTNQKHQKLKHDIMVGDGLPDIHSISQVKQALADVGFSMKECKDLSLESQTPWYDVFSGSSEFRISTPTTQFMTYVTLNALEMLRMVPKGSVTVHKTLCQGANALYAGGKEGIFTPMFFFLVQK